MKKITLQITGMHCTSCARNIEKEIQKFPEISAVQVSFASNQAQVSSWPGQELDPQKLIRVIHQLGFEAQVLPGPSSAFATNLSPALQGKIVFILLSIGVSLSMMSWEFFYPNTPSEHQQSMLLHFALSSIFLFVVGRRYLKAILRFFLTAVADMDTLVGMGTTTAYLYSTLLLFWPQLIQDWYLPNSYYFDATIMIIGLIQIGKYLEAKAKARTNQSISQLLNLQSKNALVEFQGQEQEISITDLQLGQICLVKPGTRIPTDGQIVAGASAVDESLITGEALPVDKGIGDRVIGGTINRHGFLKVEVTKVGEQTLLAQIIKTVEEAINSKAPIQKLADQIAAIFVPTIMLIAFFTGLGWFAYGYWMAELPRFIPVAVATMVSVLVIACPCALGLATPLGIIVGNHLASRRGILIKSAEALQKLQQVSIMAFDKTGTITNGRPQLLDLIPVSMEGPQLLEILQALERQCDHPISIAIREHPSPWPLADLVVENFKILEGKGITGIIEGDQYFAGNLTLLQETLGPSLAIIALVEGHLRAGKTPVFLFTLKKVCGIVTVADSIKDNSRQMIQDLEKLKIKLVMLTGDHQNVAEHIAQQVGICHIFANLLPQDKVRYLRQLQQEAQGKGKMVAMIGDGINDAPALAAADVSIAMATGPDIAIEAADITILQGNLSKIVQAIRISKYTMKKIKQNLFWAFIYNLILIPIACGVLFIPFGILLNPVLAALAMSISSLSVVANSLLMKSFYRDN